MKDSGIEWIGEEPDQWKNAKLGTSVYMKGRIGWQGLRFDDFIDEGPYLVTGTDFDGGKIIWSRCYHISEIKYSEDPAIHLRSQDVLFTKDGTVGKVAFVDKLPGPASLNSHLLLLRPKTEDLNSSFLFWVLQSSVFERYKNLVQHGSIMDSISQTDMSHFIVPLPPREEQEAIARYLDAKIGLNDRLADVVEKQISNLEHYRASVIHEAVTRGLDSTVSTKPSGIGWIGNIPTGWNLTKLQQIAYLRARLGWKGLKADEYVEEGYPLFSAFNIQNNMLVQTECDYINEQRYKESPEIMLSEGDVLLVKDGAGYGKHAYVQSLERPSTVNGSLAVLTPKNVVEGRYLHYYFDSEVFKHQARMLMTGMGVPHLTQHFLKNILLPLPPKQDQIDIADYLDARTAAIDAVLETKRKQLDILKRRRQSLINEYVTGKRRVTEEA